MTAPVLAYKKFYIIKPAEGTNQIKNPQFSGPEYVTGWAASGAGVRWLLGPPTSTNSPYCFGSGGGSSGFGFFAGTGTVLTEPMRRISCFMPAAQGVPFCIDTLPLASVHL